MIVASAYFLAAAFVAGALTYWFRTIARRRGLLDVPNERSSHSVPIPRTGGAAIALTVLSSIAVLGISGLIPAAIALAIVPSGAAIALIGFVDDLRGLPSSVRFGVQTLAVVWFLAAIGGPPDFGWSWLEGSVAARWLAVSLGLLWLLNLFNFMDGIDGIAGSEAAFVSLALVAAGVFLAGHVGGVGLVCAVVAGAAAGFLRWNWPPASVFMGDAGSGLLGFLMGVMAVMAYSEWQIGPSVPVILLGVFAVDATVTLWRRLLRGDRWYAAHRSHAYQRLSRRLGSHRAATLRVLAVNLVWLAPLAFAAASWPRWAHVLTIVALAPLVVIALWLGAGASDAAHDS